MSNPPQRTQPQAAAHSNPNQQQHRPRSCHPQHPTPLPQSHGHVLLVAPRLQDKTSSATTGAQDLPIVATTSQRTTAPPTTPTKGQSSSPQPSSLTHYAPPPRGNRPPPAKVSCSRNLASRWQQQPKILNKQVREYERVC